MSDVIHVGDIHSGKEFCTENYDASIASVWQTFTKPLVYTPGDNEWADCHKATSLTSPGQGGGFYSPTSGAINYIGTSGLSTNPADCVSYHCGNPLDNLAKVRQDFFAQPGHTLGSGTRNVVSQATAHDPSHPADAQYVENVRWAAKRHRLRHHQRAWRLQQRAPTPGTRSRPRPRPRHDEADEPDRGRRALARRGLRVDAADQPRQALVIFMQADMWDPDGNTTCPPDELRTDHHRCRGEDDRVRPARC